MPALLVEDYAPRRKAIDKGLREAGLHCGLGLALCQKSMGILGGSITVRSAVGGMFTVTLTF